MLSGNSLLRHLRGHIIPLRRNAGNPLGQFLGLRLQSVDQRRLQIYMQPHPDKPVSRLIQEAGRRLEFFGALFGETTLDQPAGFIGRLQQGAHRRSCTFEQRALIAQHAIQKIKPLLQPVFGIDQQPATLHRALRVPIQLGVLIFDRRQPALHLTDPLNLLRCALIHERQHIPRPGLRRLELGNQGQSLHISLAQRIRGRSRCGWRISRFCEGDSATTQHNQRPHQLGVHS